MQQGIVGQQIHVSFKMEANADAGADAGTTIPLQRRNVVPPIQKENTAATYLTRGKVRKGPIGDGSGHRKVVSVHGMKHFHWVISVNQ